MCDTRAVTPAQESDLVASHPAGLDAAKRFVELHSEHLEQLDLSTVLTFSPLQEVILEKLGTMPDLFSSVGVTMTDYLKQAPPDDVRLFIWALEEHRDEFVSCHSMLDDFFDMMGTCALLHQLSLRLQPFCCVLGS